MENVQNPDNQIVEVNEENKEVTVKIESESKKINFPKRKYAIIHGYNGHLFCGNQKNPGVRTVEDEMEKTFYKLNFISDCNFGVLQKIGWMRASRTDKRVSAIMNVVSCKLHQNPALDEQAMKQVINEALPKDIKVFRMIEVSKTFDSKDDNNNREYHYILPTFMLDLKSNTKPDAKSVDNFKGDYDYKITPELHDKLRQICKAFKGTKKYHNYTRKMAHSDASSNRHIYELSCDELLQFENFQVIKFKIVGQSFLYNQIRKMIGSIIDLCRECRDLSHLENTFLSNKMDVPKAPAEGLYLYKIDYSKYNQRKLQKKSLISISEEDDKEMEDFRLQLVDQIHEVEVKEGVFSKWLWRFDNMKEITY